MLHELINGAPLTMGSREIAELCGKEHRNVLRDIRKMLEELYPLERGAQRGADPQNEMQVFGPEFHKFESTYLDAQNGQVYPEFLLPKRETLILVSGYSLEFRTRIIDRWQQLELIASGVPATYPEALRLAATFADDLNKAHAALAIAAPKAAALDLIATETEGAVCLRVAAKLLQMPERKFLKFAHAKGFIFRGSHNTWIAYSEKVKAGLLELKLTKIRCTDGSERRVEQVLFTRSGLAKMAELLAKAEMKPLEVRRA